MTIKNAKTKTKGGHRVKGKGEYGLVRNKGIATFAHANWKRGNVLLIWRSIIERL